MYISDEKHSDIKTYIVIFIDILFNKQTIIKEVNLFEK